MKILWHMPTLRRDTCGLSIRALRLAKRLEQDGDTVVFAVAGRKTDIADDRIEGFSLRRLPDCAKRSLHWSLQASARREAARQVVRGLNVDHDLFITCQPEVVSAYAESVGTGPVVFVCGGTTLLHDEADRAAQTGLGRLSRFAFGLDRHLKHCNESNAFARADAVVFDSGVTRTLVIDRYAIDPRCCHVVYGGVDPDAFRPVTVATRAAARERLGIGESETVIVYAGRLSPEKHVDLLLRSIGHCRHRPDRVLIVGDGPSRTALEALAREVDVRTVVRFTGRQDDVRPFLEAADVFAFPSRCESFGGALVEAMACGLPCIALRPNGGTVRNASLEIIEDGKSGLLAERAIPRDFATALDRLAADEGLRRRLSTSARRRAVRHFSWESGGRELRAVIDRLGVKGGIALPA